MRLNTPPPKIGGRIWPTSPISSADLLGFWISPICSADLRGFCEFADSFCRDRVSGSLCAFIFFRQALFVQWNHFFPQDKGQKCKKTMGPGIEPLCGVSVIWPFCSADLLGPLGF